MYFKRFNIICIICKVSVLIHSFYIYYIVYESCLDDGLDESTEDVTLVNGGASSVNGDSAVHANGGEQIAKKSVRVDSGIETGVIENENEGDDEQKVFYDKTKSFFDTISCEAVERSKG